MASAFVIASPFSGSGKTTLSIGLMAVLRRMGRKVQPFKVGPDYIDPVHHSMVCGKPSYNLDTWMMGVEGVRRTFLRAMDGMDVGVVEGVMGLFDGKAEGGEGSTAEVSKLLSLPVVLVIDGSRMAQSVAALLNGYEDFDKGVRIEGVIFNRVGSERHWSILKEAVEKRCRATVLGYLPGDEALYIPERHLGLSVKPDEALPVLERLENLIKNHVDMDALLRLSSIPIRALSPPSHPPQKSGQVRIGVAMDEAFFFYYQENLEILEGAGAVIVPFSPLRDRMLPDDIGGLYIGGGYPELYGKKLESNRDLMEEIRKKGNEGMPIYAECGGLMYLGKGLVDHKGRFYRQVGLFPWVSKVLAGRKTLGYREVEVVGWCPFAEEGERMRGHEFHYSEIIEEDGLPYVRMVYRVIGGEGTHLEGYLYRNTLASYIHLHFASNRKFAKDFVKRCKAYKSRG